MENSTMLHSGDLNIILENTTNGETSEQMFPSGRDYALTVTAAIIGTLQMILPPGVIGAAVCSKLSEPLKVTATATCISAMVCAIALYVLAFWPFSSHAEGNHVACLAVETFHLIAISGHYLFVFCHAFLALLVVEKPFIQSWISKKTLTIVLIGIWIVNVAVILGCSLSFVPGTETSPDNPGECTFSSIPKSAIYYVDCGIVAPVTFAQTGIGIRALWLATVHRRRIESVTRAVAPSLKARPEHVTCMINYVFLTVLFLCSVCHGGLLFLLHLSVFSDATMSWVNRALSIAFYGVNCLMNMSAFFSKVMKEGFGQCRKTLRRDLANCFGS